MNIGIFPIWLIIGACAEILQVPFDITVVGVAAGIALSLFAATRQRGFITPALVAAWPPISRYLLPSAALKNSPHVPEYLLKIADFSSTPVWFVVAGVLSIFASVALAMKWMYTGKE